MADVDPDDFAALYHEGTGLQTDMTLTQEQGRMFEDISVKIIEKLGLIVADRQIALPDDYPVTGHPDGRLVLAHTTHYEGCMDVYGKLRGGLVWGWSHKHLGRYGYEDIFKKSFPVSHPNYVLQEALYGDALGWDACLETVIAQDSSSIRGDATANLRAKNPANRWTMNPEYHPKVYLYAIDIRPLKTGLVPVALERARWLSKWKEQSGEPKDVRREYDPNATVRKYRVGVGKPEEYEAPKAFDCAYCPYLARCRRDGQSGWEAPKLPWSGTAVDDDAAD